MCVKIISVICLSIALNAAILFSTSARAERYALLVGVSQYKDKSIPDLDGPEFDVKALDRILQSDWGFKSTNIVKLVNDKATRDNIIGALKKLQSRTRPGDFIFIYFSGHGTSKKDVSNQWPMPYGTGALVPHDFNVKGIPAERLKGLIVGRTDLKPILESLDQGGRDIFVAIDACYAGQSVRGMSLPKRVVELDSRGAFDDIGGGSSFSQVTKKKEPYPYNNIVYMSSSGEHETASDISLAMLYQYPTIDGKPHGAFTDTFLRVLNGSLNADYNNDGNLDYDEVYRRVREKMANRGFANTPNRLPELSEDNNKLHTRPFLQTGKIGSAFIADDTDQLLRITIENTSHLAFVSHKIKKYKHLKIVDSSADIKVKYMDGNTLLFNPRGDIVARFGLSANNEEFFGRLMQQYWIKQFVNKVNPEQNFNLTLDLTGDVTGGTAVVGEKVAFSIETEKTAYIVLLDIDSRGDVNVLYPYDISETKRVAAKKVLNIPGNTPDDMIVIEPPFGVDTVIALAFTERPMLLNRIIGKSVSIDSPQIRDIDTLISEPSSIWAKSYLTLSTFDKQRK